MSQALYRKYRSKSFEEVVGQEHITQTLRQAIKSGRISHAYLFTGPRGVGKTSVARILAHEVNDLPYEDESIHLDIIEIDGASNRRIDEIRELRDKVHISPTSAKYKVYVIDEVHMLTKEAFNALLKTLEEPPAHCIFILATTEAHKLPDTITSRTQRFEFKPIPTGQAATRLAEIAKNEKINIEKEALDLLAEHGEGSFRDSISLLDQLSSSGEVITADFVRKFLGLPPTQAIDQLAEAVFSAKAQSVLQALENLRSQGADPATIAKLLAVHLRQKLSENAETGWIAALLRHLLEIPASSQPEASLEVALLEACAGRLAGLPEEPKDEPTVVKVQPESTIIRVAPSTPTTNSKKNSQIDDQNWSQILEIVKGQAASLYTALRLASPTVEKNKVILAFEFPLHQKKINQSMHKDLIATAIAEVTGKNYAVEATIRPIAKKTEASGSGVKEPALQTISNIFGQPEVLES